MRSIRPPRHLVATPGRRCRSHFHSLGHGKRGPLGDKGHSEQWPRKSGLLQWPPGTAIGLGFPEHRMWRGADYGDHNGRCMTSCP